MQCKFFSGHAQGKVPPGIISIGISLLYLAQEALNKLFFGLNFTDIKKTDYFRPGIFIAKSIGYQVDCSGINLRQCQGSKTSIHRRTKQVYN